MEFTRILKKKEFGIFVIIVILLIIITIANNSFLRVDNILDTLRSNAVLGIMALGMLPILISGGIDLSVSATIALCAVVLGKFLVAFPNAHPIVVFIVTIGVGGMVGLINGLIITKFKIPPIVATLGTMTIINGAVLLYTNGIWITDLPVWWKEFGSFQIGQFSSLSGSMVGISSQLLLFIIAAILTAAILKYSLIGRGIYAVGGSESSAVRVGYDVDKILILIYIYSGMMVGMAAIAHIGIVGQVDPNTYIGYELDVISIVVLGGASTMGGVGTVFGTVLGLVLLAILKNGLVLARIPTYWQKVVMGVVILIAISVDVINRKKQQENLIRVDIEKNEGGL